MKKRIWLFFFILVIIAVSVYAWKEYNRKPLNLLHADAAEKLKAEELAAAFEADETIANKKYLGKIIEVEGIITNINTSQTPVHLILGNENSMHNVGISLSGHNQNIANLKKGVPVTVRGECTGFLIDVELNNAVIIK